MPDPVFTWSFLVVGWGAVVVWHSYRAGQRSVSRGRRDAIGRPYRRRTTDPKRTTR